jgi:hypothetical protein
MKHLLLRKVYSLDTYVKKQLIAALLIFCCILPVSGSYTKPVPKVADLPVITEECSVASIAPPLATGESGQDIQGVPSMTFPIVGVGEYTVVWTYTDGNLNTTTQNQTVKIVDTQAPDVSGLNLADIIITGCSYTLTPMAYTYPSVTDNCDGVITGEPDIAEFHGYGTHTIIWLFKDAHGNEATKQQSVIIDYAADPVPVESSLNDLSGTCTVNVLSYPNARDYCNNIIQGVPYDSDGDIITDLTFSGKGTYTIYWKYTDVSGRVTTQEQKVVVADNPPVPEIMNLQLLTGECSVQITEDMYPYATDDCSPGQRVKATMQSGQTLYDAAGEYTIVWAYDDGVNGVVTQDQRVKIEDRIVPVPNDNALPDIARECGFNVSEIDQADRPKATDNCSGEITGVPDEESFTEQGTHTLRWVFTDASGNKSEISQVIIIDDVTKPVPQYPVLETIEVECYVKLEAPIATDNCSGLITGTTEDPVEYDTQGTKIVTWKYDDGNGNITTQEQIVSVMDISNPIPDINILPDVVGGCNVIIDTDNPPKATDECSGTINGITNSPTLYNIPGKYVVEWEYNDGNGNVMIQEQKVIVGDVFAPVPNVENLPDLHSDCRIVVEKPVATDDCSGIIEGRTFDQLVYERVGEYLITWTYTDDNGNVATQQQRVFVEDNIPPVPEHSELPEVVVACSTVLEPPKANDNCAGEIVAITSDPISYTKRGDYTVNWVYYDGNGNKVIQQQSVRVTDHIAPIPDLPSLATVTDECSVSLKPPTATDDCDGKIIATTKHDVDIDIQGEYEVEWIYSDESGNTVSQIQKVVINDVTVPRIVAAKNSVVKMNSDTEYKVPDKLLDPSSVYDNCGVKSLTNDFNNSGTLEGAVFGYGTTNVRWTVTDHNGNESHADISVSVSLSSGLEDLYNNRIKIYPNPTRGKVHINFNGVAVDYVDIKDVTGKLVFMDSSPDDIVVIDLADKRSGLYFITIRKGGDVYSGKIVIE